MGLVNPAHFLVLECELQGCREWRAHLEKKVAKKPIMPALSYAASLCQGYSLPCFTDTLGPLKSNTIHVEPNYS